MKNSDRIITVRVVDIHNRYTVSTAVILGAPILSGRWDLAGGFEGHNILCIAGVGATPVKMTGASSFSSNKQYWEQASMRYGMRYGRLRTGCVIRRSVTRRLMKLFFIFYFLHFTYRKSESWQSLHTFGISEEMQFLCKRLFCMINEPGLYRGETTHDSRISLATGDISRLANEKIWAGRV